MAPTRTFLTVLLLCAFFGASSAGCPFGFANADVMEPPAARSLLAQRGLLQGAAFDANKVARLDWGAVKADVKKLLTASKSFWPADFAECDGKDCTGGHYGGLMIRLAWHCAGSYRGWDGRGGCDGGRIRHLPEHAWPDNTNLDKALRLLTPIKEKYGDALSWGDLIVLAGNTAIESMGGPVLGFCAGRIDAADGIASLPLGPTPEQRLIAPCKPGQGNCQNPLGASTMGLIYVNAEGPMGVPIPEKIAPQIREVFSRMNMNDSETVALIGGGHAFGKTHGACPTGAGPDPRAAPKDPWPGTCGTGPLKGRGPNAFTSGFEGAWSTTPTTWSNQYFQNLLEFDWEVHVGPGNHSQWRPKLKPGSKRSSTPDIMMLTTDVALTRDPKYLSLVKLFAADQKALDNAFKHAWYKLTTRDMGPVTRCLGPDVPPAQPFQRPLPSATTVVSKDDTAKATRDILAALDKTRSALTADTGADGKPTYGPLAAELAYRCAATFRATDKAGGCNGAHIRFSPEKDWSVNKGLDKVTDLLGPVKAKNKKLSHADLIVLAGSAALGAASGRPDLFPFCPGRVDALDSAGSAELAPRAYANGPAVAVLDNWRVAGLTGAEGVALAGRPRSAVYMRDQGYSGSWSTTPGKVDNSYFKVLLGNKWAPAKSAAGKVEYKVGSGGSTLYMTPDDLVIKNNPQLASIAKAYADDNGKWLTAFAGAWTKLMNADRWKGPAGNECQGATAVPGALVLPSRVG